ncbi:CesT family type III secretion system chaperone [Chlamydiifrater volucris]|uniref:CesT family type III secretion system chaperone n=1 Tax=Chlamydiifrater volucris TaxID=2681470 RepID=UPI001BD0FE00|nr:CesT family type III secretion system chaperone [Chlamydiifrater volucris]
MQSQFEQLMEELGKEVGSPLIPDANQACKIRFAENDVAVQMEADGPDGNIAIGAILGKVPANNFRERLFKAALSVNASHQSEVKGVLAYGEVSEQLFLCDVLNMHYLDGKKLYEYALSFSKHAAIWIGAVNSGNLPDLHSLGLYNL